MEREEEGVVVGAEEFRRRLDAYAGVVERRDAALLAFLDEPRTVAEIAQHRLVYRPHVEAPQVRPVELRTAARHLERLVDAERVVETEPGRFRAVPA